MTAQRSRALELAAVGLGQAGGNLASEFWRLGYRAVALNTARVDLRSLDQAESTIPSTQRLYIGLDDLDGAGKDPAYGRACVEEHADAIRELVKRELDNCDAVFLCAGLGGGTGSCLAELCQVLAPLEFPLAALCTLPSQAESGIVKVNAVRAASSLVELPLLARIVVDNQRIVEAHGELDLMNYYPQINRDIVAPLHELNQLNSIEDLHSLRSFDGEDLRKVLLSGGVVVVGSEILDMSGPPITAQEMERSVRRLLDGGTLLAAGLPLDKVAYLGVVLLAPERFLKQTPARDLEELSEQLKQQTGGGAVYPGLYVSEAEKPVLHLVAGSLTLPERVRSLLVTAKAEGHLLADKIREEIPPLDVGDLSKIQLYRVPPPKRRGSVPPASGPVRSTPARPARGAAAKPRLEDLSPVLSARVELPVADLEEILDAPPHTMESAEPAPAPPKREVTHVGAEPKRPSSDEPPDDLQAYYGELIDRFRGAPGRKEREEVARRLIRDARSVDVDVRAHAVWAMVSLGGRGFKAALQQAVQDEDEEVRNLAQDGLRRLGNAS